MKKWLICKKGFYMFWTYYSQNGLSWLESDKLDTLKVRDLAHAEEIVRGQRMQGYHVEVMFDYTNK